MPMDRRRYSISSSDSSHFSSTSSSPAQGSTVVLSVEPVKGSSKADEWSGDMLQAGDIVEELRIGNMTVQSPFKNGKSGVQKILHTSYTQKETSIRVRIRRGSDDFAEIQACIVPGADQLVGRRQYVLRAIDDPNYAVRFVDRTENECLHLQASRTSSMVSSLEKTPVQDGFVSYPWERRLVEMLSVPRSSNFYSILFLPKASDNSSARYNDLEDTLARAHAWINSSQASGAPIVFMNIQTESLLTKISGDTASSTVNAGSLSDLSNIAHTSLYGFEDYHGVDIGVVRAVRLWFSPLVGEIPVEIRIKETDTRLGFAISRTEEGFIYISSVMEDEGKGDDTPSARSGLRSLYKQASKSSRLLVVSRISNHKVLPWMVSPTGAIRCFDTVSVSQKLSLHRHARVPILLHVFPWDTRANVSSGRGRAMEMRMARGSEVGSLPIEEEEEEEEEKKEKEKRVSDATDITSEQDTSEGLNFQLHDFALKSNWV